MFAANARIQNQTGGSDIFMMLATPIQPAVE